LCLVRACARIHEIQSVSVGQELVLVPGHSRGRHH
jgi:hypothetical protein